MLAQEVEAAENDDLFAPAEDEAQDVKAEDAAGEVEGAEAEVYEAEGAVPRRVLPDPGQPTQSQLEDHRVDHVVSRVRGGTRHRRTAPSTKRRTCGASVWL